MSFFGFSILDLKKTIHFTSLPFPWRPPCLLLRGYAAVVVWSGMCCDHIWCGGGGRGGGSYCRGIVVVLSWYCRGIVVVLFVYIYIFGKWGKMVRKKTYLGLPGLDRWCGVVSCRVLGLAALLAVVVSVVGFVVFGVPAVAVTVTGVVTIFVDALREEWEGGCFCYCCDWCCHCRLLHKPGALAAEVEGVACFAIGADKPEAAITGVEQL